MTLRNSKGPTLALAKRTLLFCFGAATWGAATVLHGNCAAVNWLIEGDFNNGTTNAPPGWSVWSLPDWNGGWAGVQNDSNSLDGTMYVSVGNWNGAGYSEGIYQIVPATGGLTYCLSVDCAAQAWWRPEGEMQLSFLDSNKVVLASSRQVTVDPNTWAGWDQGQPWRHYELYAVAPGNATQAKVEFIMNGGMVPSWGGGTIFYDNSSLTIISPSLNIRTGTNHTAIVSWPATSDGYVLKSSPTLGSGSFWRTVTNLPEEVGGNKQVTLPMEASQFFRLEK